MRGFYEMNGCVIPDLIGDPSSEFENTGFPIELGMTKNQDDEQEDWNGCCEDPYGDDDEEEEENEREWCD